MFYPLKGMRRVYPVGVQLILFCIYCLSNRILYFHPPFSRPLRGKIVISLALFSSPILSRSSNPGKGVGRIEGNDVVPIQRALLLLKARLKLWVQEVPRPEIGDVKLQGSPEYRPISYQNLR